MQACGNSPPITVTSEYKPARHPQLTTTNILTSLLDKDVWIGKERERWAKYFSVPMVEEMPDGFPPRTLGVQRALCALSLKAPAKLPAAIEALYRSFWVDGNSKIGEPEGFTPVFESVLGKQETQELLSAVCDCTVETNVTSTDALLDEPARCQVALDEQH